MENSKQNILVVDDDSDIRNCLAEILESEDYKVFHASNGQEAMNSLLRYEEGLFFNLIVLDLNMPVMDGYQFLELVNQKFPNCLAKIPVIVITARGSINTPITAPYHSVILHKPFSIDALYQAINQALNPKVEG